MARNDPQMNLRVPVDLKEKVEKAAFENGRTITAEAVYRLEQSFNSTQENIQLVKMMGDLMVRLERLEQQNKGD
ncbi:Arc family DNA-binding protein [Acinetobacter ursingii]|uniref:Arc family DNA-binding protein n=1 Tax=Acinetobacter ursingii TaxID=108980 RepID=UPI0021CDD3C2|nr:Arc family DNA-binding protein [Acinetobacter ursingii]MCU4483566.1 Arc family DNA-binding protein [Acinetobacter ursingii]MCU4507886.1 Arc family DNA-binding protein [Acinetobacter ursingii]